MRNKVSILSTALLDQPLTDKAADAGADMDMLSFIHVETTITDDLREEIEELCTLPATTIFTSANAVRAIAGIILNHQPEWNVYCIGNATRHAVLEHFDNVLISGVADDAATLASVIQGHEIQEVVFFCGDKRMDTLPGLLSADEITVYEMVVYHTIETPHVATKSYDGILFFSPSAVSSFFSVNTLGHQTVLFAIGNTTADAIRQHTDNAIVVAATPSKEQMVSDALAYFHKKESAVNTNIEP